MKKFLEKDIKELIFTLLIFFFLANLIISPKRYIDATLNGISAWTFNVLPSVFPFIFFTKCLSSLGQVEKMTKPFQRVSKFLFKTPPISIYTFLMAILSGYPVGSKMIADLYEQGKISKSDAFKMSAFCSTSGPMFIIGAVGVMMFKNATVGYILFLSHILGAFFNGILFRKIRLKNLKEEKIYPNTKKEKFNIGEIILSSTLSILSVGGIIAIFFLVIECLSPIFNLFPQPFSSFLEGIIEITKGSLSLSVQGNVKLVTTLTSFVISFGGISTLLQSITMLKQVNMPIKLFATQKLCHAILSTIITLIFLQFIKL